MSESNACRDVYIGMLSYYVQLFTNLEEDGLLDNLNEIHLHALHLVFIPRIQKSLDEFRAQWNSHPLSTAENLSPEQLFVSGILANNHALVRCETQEANIEHLGSGLDDDSGAPFPVDDSDYDVHVPAIDVNIPDRANIILRLALDEVEEEDGGRRGW